MRRWSRLSNIEKFDAYTRWSIYSLVLVLPLMLMTWIGEQRTDRGLLREGFWLAVLALTASCLVAVWQVIGRDRAVRRLTAWALSAVVISCAACILLALRTWPTPVDGARGQAWVVLICLAYAIGSTTITRSLRATALIAVAASVAMAALWWNAGYQQALSTTIGSAILFASAIGAVRASVAMLQLMYRIDRAREVEAQLAVAEERLRFARDLHDTLGRNLSAIALKSQVARGQLGRDAAAAGEEVDAVRALADQSLTEMRAVVRGIRGTDLRAELAGARSLLSSAGIDCTVSGTASGADELAWVVREAVTNVIRHSDATRCSIDVAGEGPGASVRVWNDGARAASGAGSGIEGLRSRLARSGGTVTVSRPASGEFEIVATTGGPS